MGLFDRFRAQPKWKHGDPAVRLAAVEELPLEEQAVLATLAREDADARVRRAAVRKLYDPALLQDLAERDQDADVREEAMTVLVDLAVGAFEDSTEAESLKALDYVQEPRHLATIAKTATAEAVSLAALSRLTDGKLLGSVARRAAHASARLEAVARVEAADELFAVALKADHRDVALAAVERLTSADHLRTVAGKSAHKAVARRARARLQAMEEAEQVAAPAPAAVVEPDWNVERDKLCRAVEELAAEHDWHAIESRLASAETRWAGLPGAQDPARAARFAAACDRARQASARLHQEEAERAERAERFAREQAERVAICERLEALAAGLAEQAERAQGGSDDVPGQLEAARQEWTKLPPSSGDAEALERRFERARTNVERQFERARLASARRGRLAELAGEAEALVDQASSSEQRPRWNALKQEWADLGGRRMAGDELAARFEAAESSVARREAEAREAEQRRQREEMERIQHLCEQLGQVAASETLTLKDGDRALREIRAALESLGALSKKDKADAADRLRAVQSILFPRVHELREADEWARWANVGIQEELCARAEALRGVADAAEAAQQLRELQQQWKKAAAVPRDKAQVLWERFKKASDEVHGRAEAHFAQQAAERETNLARKEALCQQAEALAESSDWIKTAEAIKALQAEWTAIGPVPRGHEKAVWERFRGACDRFFTRRREDLTKRKEEWAANLARKEALIAQVEALADTTTDWPRAIDDVKRLQAEWKAVGPVRRNRSDEVWQRFRAACDRFFERYQQRDQVQVAGNIAVREKLCTELEALLPPVAGPASLATAASASGAAPAVAIESSSDTGAAASEHAPRDLAEEPSAGGVATMNAVEPGASPEVEAAVATSDAGLRGSTDSSRAIEPPEGLREKVQTIRAQWQQAPTLMPRDVLARLNERYTDALTRVARAYPSALRGTDLDLDAIRQKAEDLCARVENAIPSSETAEPADTPATILAARLREALAANTIGGVGVADMESKWRAATAAVKEAQAAWAALTPMPAEVQQSLGGRFQRACRRFFEAAEKHRR